MAVFISCFGISTLWSFIHHELGIGDKEEEEEEDQGRAYITLNNSFRQQLGSTGLYSAHTCLSSSSSFSVGIAKTRGKKTRRFIDEDFS
jgi:hypothetical protein